MKTSALIAVLQDQLAKHGDLEVEVTWEGVIRPIDAGSVYPGKDGQLLIDGDGNFYESELRLQVGHL